MCGDNLPMNKYSQHGFSTGRLADSMFPLSISSKPINRYKDKLEHVIIYWGETKFHSTNFGSSVPS